MKRPRVVLLRGAGLSASEMSYFAPLSVENGGDFELVAVGALHPAYARGVAIPVVEPAWPDEALWRRVSGRPRSFFNWAIRRIGGLRYPLPGLGRILEGADIVHALELRPGFTYQAARLKERLGFRLVASVSENIAHPRSDDFRARRRIARVIEACDKFVALTESAKAALLLEGAPAEKVEVIPHGVDPCVFRPPEDPPPADGPPPVDLLFVGRLAPEKGAADLIAAAGLLGLRNRPVSLALAGEGPEQAHLARLASAWNVSATFLPWLPREALAGWYRRAKVVVIPSLATAGIREQFSFAALEAMASGLPVVATRVGALPEVLGDAAEWAAAGSPRELADAVLRLLEDDARRRALGEAGRARVLARFTVEKTATAWGALYRRLL